MGLDQRVGYKYFHLMFFVLIFIMYAKISSAFVSVLCKGEALRLSQWELGVLCGSLSNVGKFVKFKVKICILMNSDRLQMTTSVLVVK